MSLTLAVLQKDFNKKNKVRKNQKNEKLK